MTNGLVELIVPGLIGCAVIFTAIELGVSWLQRSVREGS